MNGGVIPLPRIMIMEHRLTKSPLRAMGPTTTRAGHITSCHEAGDIGGLTVSWPVVRETVLRRVETYRRSGSLPSVLWVLLVRGVGMGSAPVMMEPRAYAQAPDEELIAWSGDGDRRAFDEILVRHGPFALRLAVRMIPDRIAAEDIVQEAMMRAWIQAARFDPTRARFRTWLYRIVVNLCIDHTRRIQPMQLTEDFDIVDPGANAEDLMAADERRSAVLKALRSLPARQRAVVTLVYDEGISGAEAARILGVSAKAVERLLARARNYLREHITRQGLKEFRE